MRTSHRTAPVATTTRTKPSLFSRLTSRRAAPVGRAPVRSHARTTTTSRRHGRTTAAPVQQRRPGLGDKITGALMRLKGSFTRRPGVKGAGTKRMRGTDGRGSRTKRRAY